MGRIRLTQVFPFLLPLRKRQRKFCFYLKMRLDRNRYAHTIQTECLPYTVFSAQSALINPDSGFDLQYQYNKVFNLKLSQPANGPSGHSAGRDFLVLAVGAACGSADAL